MDRSDGSSHRVSPKLACDADTSVHSRPSVPRVCRVPRSTAASGPWTTWARSCGRCDRDRLWQGDAKSAGSFCRPLEGEGSIAVTFGILNLSNFKRCRGFMYQKQNTLYAKTCRLHSLTNSKNTPSGHGLYDYSQTSLLCTDWIAPGGGQTAISGVSACGQVPQGSDRGLREKRVEVEDPARCWSRMLRSAGRMNIFLISIFFHISAGFLLGVGTGLKLPDLLAISVVLQSALREQRAWRSPVPRFASPSRLGKFRDGV